MVYMMLTKKQLSYIVKLVTQKDEICRILRSESLKQKLTKKMKNSLLFCPW